MKKRKVLIVAASVLCCFSLFLQVPVFAKSGATVRVGIEYAPSTVNMLEVKLGNDLPVVLCMHESLMTADPKTGDLVPFLAKKFEFSNDGKDLKVWLRKGARFHTGDPLTARDVKFTYEQCVDPANANMLAGPLDEIESIDVIDDYTLVFHFWEPYAGWKELMWIGICSKNYFDKVGREEFRKHPVGSGIFRFVDRDIGERITLEVDRKYANKNFLKSRFGLDLPNFDRLEFVVVPDTTTRLAMLETGELDLISNILPQHMARLKNNKHVKIKITDQVPSLIGLAGLPDSDPIVADRNFGLALRHAINRQEIIDRIFLGQGYPLYIYANRFELGYEPSVKYDFNPKKAKEYLKKSSYKPGHVITLTYTSMVPNASLVAASIQKYLQDIGITVKLQKLEEGTAATYTRNRDKRLGALRLYSWGGSRDPSIRLMLSVLSTSPYAAVRNRPRKTEMDMLINAQAHELDRSKRLAILKKIHGIMAYDAVGTYLFGLNMIYAMSDRIDYTWTPKEPFLFNLHTIKVVK